MANDMKLPKLGESVDSGVVSRILVQPGDSVTEGQPVIELETEKATVEVPAASAGTVKEVRVKEGETIKVGQVILIVDGGAESQKPDKQRSDGADQVAPRSYDRSPAQPRKQTASGDRPKTGLEGGSTQGVAASQTLPPRRSSSESGGGPGAAPTPAKAPAAPEPRKSDEPEEQGQAAAQSRTGEIEGRSETQPQAAELVPASPSVRRMARELGVDIAEVTGSGPGSRITEEDVRNYARSIILNVTKGESGPRPPASALPDFTQWGEVERRSMTTIRRKTAERTANAWQAIPHVTHFDNADITELEKMRQLYADRAAEAGGKLTITAIALKIVASALKRFPQFNASLDIEGAEIIYKRYYDIGVAVETDFGLLVPVIRSVDKKNLLELSAELTEVAERARQKKLTLEEMKGGTFTITNLGGIGGSGFTPIINSPEVAILAMSRAEKQPVFIDGSFQPRLMLPLGLSYDHRLIDGADAAQFLRWVAEAFRQPFVLTLEG